MIETKELAEICGVSLKSVTKWAARNGVSKVGYRWNFTPNDCRKLFEYYKVEPDELPLNLINEPLNENEQELPLNEDIEESKEQSYEEHSTSSKLIEANEQLVEAYKRQVEILQEQVRIQGEQLEEKDKQIANQSAQITELISTNKALSASNAVHVASDKKDILLAEPQNSDNQEIDKKQPWWKKLFS